MTSRWFCYVEGFPSERCLLLHWTRKEHRHVDDYREYPYPLGHKSCGWVDLPDRGDKRELAA